MDELDRIVSGDHPLPERGTRMRSVDSVWAVDVITHENTPLAGRRNSVTQITFPRSCDLGRVGVDGVRSPAGLPGVVSR